MSSTTQSTLKGFRDFLPAEVRQRQFVANKIQEIFAQFDFAPLETPTLEYAALLLGKYGTEADKLVYTFTDNGDRHVGLRYDQTVPTARVLHTYQHQLPKYFRRYQMQNVFRAEKPQKGRYREFRQCDIDIFNTTSATADAEILACTYFAFKNIGFQHIELRINDRQTLLNTLQPFATEAISVFSIIQSIDKLDKISEAEVTAELIAKGLEPSSAGAALHALTTSQQSANLMEIVTTANHLGVPMEALVFTPSLARGLDYYTGMIFEAVLPEYSSGSCGGGGRYDDLIADLGGPSMPAVGMAFGFDRTVEAAMALHLIPETALHNTVLVTIFANEPHYIAAACNVAAQLRSARIVTQLFPEANQKLAKQFKYADQIQARWAVVIGDSEVTTNQLVLKDLQSGNQQLLTIDRAVDTILAENQTS